MRRPDPAVMLVPPSLLLELFALSRYASRTGLHREATEILRSLRGLRPDVPEFSAYLSLSLMELGSVDEAKDVLDEYLRSDLSLSSLVLSLQAKLLFDRDDPSWRSSAQQAVGAFSEDGGGMLQKQILAGLPGMESLSPEGFQA